jgi:hypothetical protein
MIIRFCVGLWFAFWVATAMANDGSFDIQFGPNANGIHDFSLQFDTLPGSVGIGRKVVEVPGRTIFEAPRYWVMTAYNPDPVTGVARAVATARFTNSGLLDTTYGSFGIGKAVTAVSMDSVVHFAYTRWQRNVGPTVTVFDRIFVLGSDQFNGSPRLRLCSITPTAQLDPSFAAGGCAGYRFEDFGGTTGGTVYGLHAIGELLYVVADRRGASGERSVGVLRINAENGTIDTSYGFAGYASVSFPGTGLAFFARSTLDPSGRLVVLGDWTRDGVKTFGIARLTNTGVTDGSFCADASSCGNSLGFQHLLTAAQIGVANNSVASAIVAATNRIFVAVQDSATFGNGHIVALREEGPLATEFGPGGFRSVTTTNPALTTEIKSLYATPGGRVLLGGVAELNGGTPQDNRMLVSRLDRRGACDYDFCPRLDGLDTPRIFDITVDAAGRPLLLTDSLANGRVRLIRLGVQQDLLSNGFE